MKESGIPVVWQCDAVHGNGVVASNKYKTRKMDDIVKDGGVSAEVALERAA